MSSDVGSWVKECSVCARAKSGPGLSRYPFQQSQVGLPLEFESLRFQAVCHRLDLDKIRTTPHRSQSDGLVERFNDTLQIMLSSFVNENRNDWNDHLPYLLMAYRAIEHISTGSHHIK